MENGKWKTETLPAFSVFHFPFSIFDARASARSRNFETRYISSDRFSIRSADEFTNRLLPL
jgi:hypothetical protein